MKWVEILIVIVLLMGPGSAMATQAHGEPEGIYAHQLSHLFFMVSMMIFIYWVRQKKLVRHKGWRFIQYAALFFILWNLNVVVVHFLDEQSLILSVEKINTLQVRIVSNWGKWVEMYYYVGKMDHLLCVPALIFLFAGLKQLFINTSESQERHGP